MPLVLLPGMGCSARLWDDVVAEWRAGWAGASTREVVVPPVDRPTLDEQVEALLEDLPEQFAVGGLSLGAIVAMAVHRRAPERVSGLFLVATNARRPTDEQRSGWRHQLDRLDAGAPPRALQADLLPALVGPGAALDLRERTLEMADDVGAARLAAQLALQSTRVDERPALARAAVPCTIVAAGADGICPIERHTEIQSLVPASELVVIEGAPHLVTLSHPRQVAQAMACWVQRLER